MLLTPPRLDLMFSIVHIIVSGATNIKPPTLFIAEHPDSSACLAAVLRTISCPQSRQLNLGIAV